MEILKKKDGDTLEIAVIGPLDTITSPQFEDELTLLLDNVKHLVLDFAQLEYISSAGLRVLLAAQQVMETQGSLTVRHVPDSIMEVFELTGFIDFLTIE